MFIIRQFIPLAVKGYVLCNANLLHMRSHQLLIKSAKNLVELQQKANNAPKSSSLLVKLIDLIPCLLTLLCTEYWRGVLKAFVYLIKRDRCTAEMIRDSAVNQLPAGIKKKDAYHVAYAKSHPYIGNARVL